MKIAKSFFSSLLLTSMLSTTAFANDFFEVGKTYLFIPRVDVVMKGKVVQVTDQEIVFTDRYVLKASKIAKGNDEKAAKLNRAAIAEYLSSKNKASLLEEIQLKNVPISYSRSAMTAIKIDE